MSDKDLASATAEEGTAENAVVDETPKKKKPNIALMVGLGLLALYAIFAVVAIYLQSTTPKTLGSEDYEMATEEYAAKIVAAHNELLSVDFEGVLKPGQKIGAIEITFARSELDKRIKTMQKNAEKLAALSCTDGYEQESEDIQAFAAFISDDWTPFWETVKTDIGDCKTADDAFVLWDKLKDIVQNQELGSLMRASFGGLGRAGKAMGWDESSYRARLR
jgi:hypothetical protein